MHKNAAANVEMSKSGPESWLQFQDPKSQDWRRPNPRISGLQTKFLKTVLLRVLEDKVTILGV